MGLSRQLFREIVPLKTIFSHLDYFLDSPDEFGYNILRNVSLTFNDTLGKYIFGP
jgi:hypothetical protein